MRPLLAFNDAAERRPPTSFTDACLDALLAATGRGSWRSYAELAPSVVAD